MSSEKHFSLPERPKYVSGIQALCDNADTSSLALANSTDGGHNISPPTRSPS
jgi:hypothetical protein